MSFDLFRYFGVDLNNDTLAEILDMLDKKGIGNACITPKRQDDQPMGMFMLLADTEAIPYVERALEEYARDCEDEV